MRILSSRPRCECGRRQQPELQGCEDGNTVTYAGDDYHTITIGQQCWFLEYLNTDQFQDGTPIVEIQDNAEWQAAAIPAWSYYANSENYFGEPRVNYTMGTLSMMNWRYARPGGGFPTTGTSGDSKRIMVCPRRTVRRVAAMKRMLRAMRDETFYNGWNTYGFTAKSTGYRSSQFYGGTGNYI